MHLGRKQQALCAPLLVSPVISEALHVKRRESPLLVKGGIQPYDYDFHGNRKVFLHAAKLRHRTKQLSLPSGGREGKAEKSDGFGRV
jgi:hypothetical protein